jgi:hypothetical protein
MNQILYSNEFGKIVLPNVPHKDRKFGGHLMVRPAILVHHSYELLAFPKVFVGYQILISIAERAMLEVLPCLNGSESGKVKGIVNHLAAGNWEVHDDRDPVGVKKGAEYRSLHMHLYGRSPLEPASPEVERKKWGGGWGEMVYLPKFHQTPFNKNPKLAKSGWKVPEGFTKEEIKLLTDRVIELADEVDWEEGRPK